MQSAPRDEGTRGVLEEPWRCFVQGERLAARSAEAAGLRGGAGRRGRGRHGAQSAAAKPHGARAAHGYGH
eukprot:1348688-Prymnesium_polylepis.1